MQQLLYKSLDIKVTGFIQANSERLGRLKAGGMLSVAQLGGSSEFINEPYNFEYVAVADDGTDTSIVFLNANLDKMYVYSLKC